MQACQNLRSNGEKLIAGKSSFWRDATRCKLKPAAATAAILPVTHSGGAHAHDGGLQYGFVFFFSCGWRVWGVALNSSGRTSESNQSISFLDNEQKCNTGQQCRKWIKCHKNTTDNEDTPTSPKQPHPFTSFPHSQTHLYTQTAALVSIEKY